MDSIRTDSGTEPLRALSPAFAEIVLTARGWDEGRREDLQRAYETAFTAAGGHDGSPVKKAGEDAYNAIVAAGLVDVAEKANPARAWVYLDELSGILGGAADVAL